MTDRERVVTAYEEMYRAMIAKDGPALAAVLDEGFSLTHMTGMRQSRAAFIRAVLDGTLNYFRAVHAHEAAALHGDEAVLVGQSVVSAAVFGGGRHTWRL